MTEFDPVNRPSHYNQGKVECIDAIEAALTPEEFRGYLKGNVMKYVWRERNKGGSQDCEKAAWYLDRLNNTLPQKAMADYQAGRFKTTEEYVAELRMNVDECREISGDMKKEIDELHAELERVNNENIRLQDENDKLKADLEECQVRREESAAANELLAGDLAAAKELLVKYDQGANAVKEKLYLYSPPQGSDWYAGRWEGLRLATQLLEGALQSGKDRS